MAMDLHYYYGDCTTPEAQAQIKQNFIQILNESFFNEVCQDPVLKDKCKAENVKVTCSVVVSVTSRRKRSAGMVKLHEVFGRWEGCVCSGGGGGSLYPKICVGECSLRFLTPPPYFMGKKAFPLF